MHTSSYNMMTTLVAKYRDRLPANPLVCDLGAADVNGTYRSIFSGWARYCGVDTAPAANVDVVAWPYEVPTPAGPWNVITCGQVLEHVEDMPRLVKAIAAALALGGLCFLTAPHSWEEHRYPVDCWRILRDGMLYLLRTADLQPLEVFMHATDTWGVGAKTQAGVATLEGSLDAPVRYALEIMQRAFLTRTTYHGVPACKNPLDTWIYDEIMHETQPDVVIDIGLYQGGGTLRLAHACDALQHGRIIGIDSSLATLAAAVRAHPRVTLFEGAAVEVFAQIREIVQPSERVMVIEDSSHTYENTLGVLNAYSQLLQVGDYIVIEDGICHHGLNVGPTPGPYEAVEAFTAANPAFASDRTREKFLLTWNPKGYIQRTR